MTSTILSVTLSEIISFKSRGVLLSLAFITYVQHSKTQCTALS